MDYNARFYSPTLGRFTQPDTIIPGMANPQSWNRYSYVGNNPILYKDPTDHMRINDDQIGGSPIKPPPLPCNLLPKRKGSSSSGGSYNEPHGHNLVNGNAGGITSDDPAPYNVAVKSDSKTIYYSKQPGSELEIQSAWIYKYATGSPYTINLASTGPFITKQSMATNSGFSMNVSTTGNISYQQSALADALNDMVNSSSGIGFNPIKNEVNINLSVQYGNESVTNRLIIKTTDHPEESAVVAAVGVVAIVFEFLGALEAASVGGVIIQQVTQ
jgi:hypothetical protein